VSCPVIVGKRKRKKREKGERMRFSIGGQTERMYQGDRADRDVSFHGENIRERILFLKKIINK
jgi:hypothetical protein